MKSPGFELALQGREIVAGWTRKQAADLREAARMIEIVSAYWDDDALALSIASKCTRAADLLERAVADREQP